MILERNQIIQLIDAVLTVVSIACYDRDCDSCIVRLIRGGVVFYYGTRKKLVHSDLLCCSFMRYAECRQMALLS